MPLIRSRADGAPDRALAWGMRLGLPACVALAIAIAPASSAAAPPSKSACIDAYKTSQELSRAGTLTRARSAALLCARDPCPAVLRKDCAEWVADLDMRLPTLLVVLRDESGRDVAAARVSVDGVEVANRLDGRPIDVDPGEHTIAVTVEGRPPLQQSIIAREREKAREVVFAFEPSKPKTAPSLAVLPTSPRTSETRAARPLPWTFWAATGTSGVALAAFGVLGVSGLVLRDDLNGCKPTCSEERLDHGRTTFLVADISLGVAVVGAGIATFIYLMRP